MDDDDPVVLDEHRGMGAQKATEARRLRAEVKAAQRAALRRRQAELERQCLQRVSDIAPSLPLQKLVFGPLQASKRTSDPVVKYRS